MEEIAYTTKDGEITVTVCFNTDQTSYPAGTIREVILMLRTTASSLEFGLDHPEFEGLGLGNDS